MKSLRNRRAYGGLLSGLLAVTVGCSNGDTKEGPKPQPTGARISVEVGGRPTQHLDLDDFEIDWDDVDVEDNGQRNAVQVARWAKVRHDGALKCLRADPPDYAQAAFLFDLVLQKVPSASKSRRLLAELLFSNAAYWWRTADAIAWEMERVALEGTASAKGVKLTEAEIKELLTEYQPYRDNANAKSRDQASQSLRQFQIYRQQRPDDKSVLDFVWKLYFFVQEYQQAIRWLDYVLKEMDNAEVPQEDPLRDDYLTIRRSMASYLAEQRISGGTRNQPSRGLFPFESGRGRDRLREDFTPGE